MITLANITYGTQLTVAGNPGTWAVQGIDTDLDMITLRQTDDELAKRGPARIYLQAKDLRIAAFA